jgi:hypothetical protein
VEEIQQQKEGERQQGTGKDNSSPTQDLSVNLGIAAAAHCFPGCESGELGLEGTGLH